MKLKSWILLLALQVCVACATAPSADKAEGDVDGCHTPLGFVPEGTSATGYLHPIEHGEPCQQGQITCTDGVWAGVFIYPSCIPN